MYIIDLYELLNEKLDVHYRNINVIHKMEIRSYANKLLRRYLSKYEVEKSQYILKCDILIEEIKHISFVLYEDEYDRKYDRKREEYDNKIQMRLIDFIHLSDVIDSYDEYECKYVDRIATSMMG